MRDHAVCYPQMFGTNGAVAVVEKIIDDRHILLNHANWSQPGMIEPHALAIDISGAGDWSKVRVWYTPTCSLGLRVNPTHGFIYDVPPIATDEDRLASEDDASSESIENAGRGG